MSFVCKDCRAELTAKEVASHHETCVAVIKRNREKMAMLACPVCGEDNPHAGKDGELGWMSNHICSPESGDISQKVQEVRSLLIDVLRAVDESRDIVTPEAVLLWHIRNMK